MKTINKKLTILYFNSLNNYAMQQRWSSKKYRIEGGRAASKPCSIFFNAIVFCRSFCSAWSFEFRHGFSNFRHFLFNLKTLLK